MGLRGEHRDQAFEEFFDEVFPRAQGVAHRLLGNRGAAEDIAAEALTRAYARWPRLRSAPYRDGWVLKVTTNLAIDALRKRVPTPEANGAPAPDDIATLRAALAHALGQLPRRQREVIALRFFCDMTEAETAAALALAPGTVKSHTHRAMAALRQRLRDDPEEMSLALHQV